VKAEKRFNKNTIWEENTMKVTRNQMIKAVGKNVDAREARMQVLRESGRGKSLEMEGVRTRHGIALDLFRALQKGYAPNTREVVGYFGKGARFEGKP
jgi:hypothetical protein